MMARGVVGAIMSAGVGVMILWFYLPLLWTVYQNFTQQLDTNDPYISSLVNQGNMIYYAMPLVVILVTGFTIWAYATERGVFDRN